LHACACSSVCGIPCVAVGAVVWLFLFVVVSLVTAAWHLVDSVWRARDEGWRPLRPLTLVWAHVCIVFGSLCAARSFSPPPVIWVHTRRVLHPAASPGCGTWLLFGGFGRPYDWRHSPAPPLPCPSRPVVGTHDGLLCGIRDPHAATGTGLGELGRLFGASRAHFLQRLLCRETGRVWWAAASTITTAAGWTCASCGRLCMGASLAW
jgi:hypothetical protein